MLLTYSLSLFVIHDPLIVIFSSYRFRHRTRAPAKRYRVQYLAPSGDKIFIWVSSINGYWSHGLLCSKSIDVWRVSIDVFDRYIWVSVWILVSKGFSIRNFEDLIKSYFLTRTRSQWELSVLFNVVAWVISFSRSVKFSWATLYSRSLLFQLVLLFSSKYF